MKMKRNKIFSIIVIMFVLAFLFAGCGILPDSTSTKGAISGKVMIPPDASKLSKDISGWVPAAGAEVTVVDADGVTHTVIADEDGYYSFENIVVNPNTVITATVEVDGTTVVLKKVIPVVVAEGDNYDAGTMDPESTALALVAEQLLDAGMDPGDIDLDEIKNTDSFPDLVEQVTTAIEEGKDVTEDPDVTDGVDEAVDEIINPPDPPGPPTPPAPSVSVTGVEIDQDDQDLVIGQTLSLTAKVSPSNASNKKVTWASDDEAVATVTNDGTVTAVGEETATITVTTVDKGKTDSIEISVVKIRNTTQGTDHNTIQGAINDAAEGNTILVGAGTYNEAFNFRTDQEGNVKGAATNLTLKAVGDVVIKNPEPETIKAGFNIDENMGTITIDGFKISDFESGISQSYTKSNGTTVYALNNEIWADYTGTMRNGIQVSGDNSVIRGNTIHAEAFVEGWQSTGIMVINAEDVLVEDNHMNNNVKIGINVNSYGGDLLAKNIILRNNVISSAQYGIQIQSQGTGRPFEVEGIAVEGNTITNNDGENNQGISIYKVNLKNSSIENNTIAEEFTHIVRVCSDSTVDNVTLDGEELVIATGVIIEWISGEDKPKVGETLTASFQQEEVVGTNYIWKYHNGSWVTAQEGPNNTFVPEVASKYYYVLVWATDQYGERYVNSHTTEGYTEVVNVTE